MLIVEVLEDDLDLANEVREAFEGSEELRIDSLDGNDIIQIMVPLVSIISTQAAVVLQKYFSDNRVTIKYDGIEISAMGYDKAMEILKKIQEQRRSSTEGD